MAHFNQSTQSSLHIAVIGPGALGTLFAARLARAGTDTLLFDYRPDRAAQLDAQGLRVLTSHGEQHVAVPVTADPTRLSACDAALVLVKAYQTDTVATLLAEHLPEQAIVVSLQNGLGNLETLALHFGPERVFGGTTAQGALLEALGVVRDTGGGPTVVGRIGGQADARLDDFCQALLLAGFAVSITDDVQAAIWQKVILNAAINAVGALTRQRNGQLAAHESSLKVMVAAAREAFAVARAHGIALEEQDWSARLRAICEATAPNINSMLQDVLHSRRTEMEAINGAIVRIAEQHRLNTPVNRTLWHLITTIENGYTKQVIP